VDKPIEVTDLDEAKIVIGYFQEKGTSKNGEDLRLSDTSTLRNGESVMAQVRELEVEDEVGRDIESRYFTATATVSNGFLEVEVCSDLTNKVGLKGGTYTGIVVVGGPEQPSIEIPIEVSYRSRTALLVLVAIPIVGFLAAWTLHQDDKAVLTNWYFLFFAAMGGAGWAWFEYLDERPGFSGSVLVGLLIATWAGATAAPVTALGAKKTKDALTGANR
jgi:hypothetical protein